MDMLLVDDDPLALATLRLAVNRPSVEARSIDDGLALAREHQPAVIVLDVIFGWKPRTGVDAVSDYLRAVPHAAIIVLTADHQPDDEARALDAGAFAYLEKLDVAQIGQLVADAHEHATRCRQIARKRLRVG